MSDNHRYLKGQLVCFNMGYLARHWSSEGPREIGTVIRDEDDLTMVAVAFPSRNINCASLNLELVRET